MATQGLNYNVDIVMCIDCTGSMSGLLDNVKNNARKFYLDLQRVLRKKNARRFLNFASKYGQ